MGEALEYFDPASGTWKVSTDDAYRTRKAEELVERIESTAAFESEYGYLSERDRQRMLDDYREAEALLAPEQRKVYAEPIQPFISNYGRERHAPPTPAPVDAGISAEEEDEYDELIAAATRHRLERAAQELADEDTVHDAHSPAEAVHDAPSPEEHKAAVSFRHDPSGVFVVTGRGPMLTHTSREAAAAEFDRRCKAARA